MQFFSRLSPFTSSDKNSVGESQEKREHPLLEVARFALIAILIVIPIRTFIAQPFIVSGTSMEDTFQNGEYLIVDQVSYYFQQPARGDVVIFRYPRDPSKYFIKRIIGVPGDTVIIDGNEVTIKNAEYPDGIVLNESYIADMTPGAPIDETLGEREYFVMGDNRNASSDSRVWGVLQEDRIIGRAFLRLFPPTAADYFPGALPNDPLISSS